MSIRLVNKRELVGGCQNFVQLLQGCLPTSVESLDSEDNGDVRYYSEAGGPSRENDQRKSLKLLLGPSTSYYFGAYGNQ